MPLTPDEQVYYDEQLRAVRAAIDPASFEAAWSKGHALAMEDAIAFAVG